MSMMEDSAAPQYADSKNETLNVQPPLDADIYCNYYDGITQIKVYERYLTGTVVMSLILAIGVILFVYRMWGVLILSCSWAVKNSFFIPPVQFVVFGLMIAIDPSEHLDTLCLVGQILVPLASFSYCAFMIYQSVIHNCWFELAFYALLTLVQVTIMLPESRFGVKYFRPFLKRPVEDVEAERMEIIRKFRLPVVNSNK